MLCPTNLKPRYWLLTAAVNKMYTHVSSPARYAGTEIYSVCDRRVCCDQEIAQKRAIEENWSKSKVSCSMNPTTAALRAFSLQADNRWTVTRIGINLSHHRAFNSSLSYLRRGVRVLRSPLSLPPNRRTLVTRCRRSHLRLAHAPSLSHANPDQNRTCLGGNKTVGGLHTGPPNFTWVWSFTQKQCCEGH